jgi:hypothetical protein
MIAVAAVLAAGFPSLDLLAQAADPLIGTWEINLAKSKYNPGPPPKSQTRIYAVVGQGVKVSAKSVSAEGKPQVVESTFAFDNKEYPLIGSTAVDTQAVKRIDSHNWETILRKGGKVVQTVRGTISKDGKTLTITYKGTNAQGQTNDDVMVFDRR